MASPGILETVLYAGTSTRRRPSPRPARPGALRQVGRPPDLLPPSWSDAADLQPRGDDRAAPRRLSCPARRARPRPRLLPRQRAARRLAHASPGAGIAIEADFEWPGGGRSIYFRDPAGNCLEFAEPRIWGLRDAAPETRHAAGGGEPNPGKLWEINELIRPYGLEAVSAGASGCRARGERDDVRGQRAAQGARRRHGSGLPALADDSGLAVDALDGAPGVTSARWAGPTRDFAVATAPRGRAGARGSWASGAPRAHFVSALCLAWPDGETHVFEAVSMAASCGRRAALAASATIRCSSPKATT